MEAAPDQSNPRRKASQRLREQQSDIPSSNDRITKKKGVSGTADSNVEYETRCQFVVADKFSAPEQHSGNVKVTRLHAIRSTEGVVTLKSKEDTDISELPGPPIN